MPRNLNETKEEAIKRLRTQAIQDTEAVAKKQRFALFSSPPPLCVGEDSNGIKNLHGRDNNGKVITLPRNFQISPTKSGKIKASYFNEMSYVTIGDKYFDPGRLDRLNQLEQKRKMPADKGLFKPADYYKTIIKSSYKHESDFKLEKKNFRNAEGKVITQPFNIVTGPQYKPLYKTYEHKPEEYERARSLQALERKLHIEKTKDHAPFKTMEHGNKPFVKDAKTYGLDRPIPERRKHKELNLNSYKHEDPFKPSNPPKKGYNKTIGKFPEYKGDPLKPITRKPVDTLKKDSFKTCHCGGLTRPTPSITSHPINIKKEILGSTQFIK